MKSTSITPCISFEDTASTTKSATVLNISGYGWREEEEEEEEEEEPKDLFTTFKDCDNNIAALVAVIQGCSRGIGLSLSKFILSNYENSFVVGTCRNPPRSLSPSHLYGSSLFYSITNKKNKTKKQKNKKTKKQKKQKNKKKKKTKKQKKKKTKKQKNKKTKKQKTNNNKGITKKKK